MKKLRVLGAGVAMTLTAVISSPNVHAQSCGGNSSVQACNVYWNLTNPGNGDYEGYYTVWGGDASSSPGIVAVGGYSYYGVGTQGNVTTSGQAGVYGVVENTLTPSDVPTNGVGSGVVGTSTLNYGVYGYSSNSDGIFGEVNSNAYGVAGANDSTGLGVYAISNYGDALHAYAPSSNTSGVVGLAGTSSTGGYHAGVLGVGSGVAGVVGYVSASTNQGVLGVNTATTGAAYGMEGQSSSNGGAGVYGTNSTYGYGVLGKNTASGGTGVGATATGSDSFAVYGYDTSNSGIAVIGQNSSTGLGVVGTTNGASVPSSGTYAIYGNSGTTGTAGSVPSTWRSVVRSDARVDRRCRSSPIRHPALFSPVPFFAA